MKKTICTSIILTFILSGCMQMRYITEQQIKNNVENHVPNQVSSIRTYSIFKGMTFDNSAYLELTGFKYEGEKGLVIGADKYYQARQKFAADPTKIAEISYVRLSNEEVKAILVNYRLLQAKIKEQKIKANEEVYSDFTVNDNLFISFHKAKFAGNKNYIDFWVNKEKYTLETNTIMGKLEKFMEY